MNIILEYGIKQGIKHGRIVKNNNTDYDEETLHLNKILSQYNSRKTAMDIILSVEQKKKKKMMQKKKKQSKCHVRAGSTQRSLDLSVRSLHTTTENLSNTYTPSMSPICGYGASIPAMDLNGLDFDTDLSDYSDATLSQPTEYESSSFATHPIQLQPTKKLQQNTKYIHSDNETIIYIESSDNESSSNNNYKYPWSHHASSDDEFANISEQAAMNKILQKMKPIQFVHCDDVDCDKELTVHKQEEDINETDYADIDISQYVDKQNGRYLTFIIYDSDAEGDDEDGLDQDLDCVRPRLALLESETALDENDGGCNDIDSI